MTDRQLNTLVNEVLGNEPITYVVKDDFSINLYLDNFYVGRLYKDYVDDRVLYGFAMTNEFINKLMVFNMLPRKYQSKFINSVYQKMLSIISPELPKRWDEESKDLKYLMKTNTGILFY